MSRIAAAGGSLLAAACGAHAAGDCVQDVAELRRLVDDPAFALRWRETTMRDGKPMVLALADAGGALHVSFHKSGEGLWAEGAARLCRTHDGLEVRIGADDLRLGPAANWLLRQALRSGARFSFARDAQGKLEVATTGWRGTFTAAD